MDIDEWHPPSDSPMPVGPQSFPRSGVNSLASLGGRGVARIIDTLLVGVPFAIVAWVVYALVSGSDGAAANEDQGAWLDVRSHVAIFGPAAVTLTLYETVMVALWGQTVGKMVMGIRVARQANGRCPLWWEAGLRIGLVGVVIVIPHELALFAAMILFTTAGFDPMRRNLTDRAAGTVVVRAR